MDLHHRTPGAPLNRFVQSFWVARSQAPAHRKERLLPDGAMALVINLHEDQTRIYDRQNADLCQRFNGCLLMGVHSEHFVIDTAEQVSVAGIHFRPGGAFPFLGMPADELEGEWAMVSGMFDGMPLDSNFVKMARRVPGRMLLTYLIIAAWT